MEKLIVVLAMHGVPPNDLPQREIAEYFSLHSQMEHAPTGSQPASEQRYRELDTKVRTWTRTEANDPYFAASQQIAVALSTTTGYQVIVGFNEFCNPDLDEAIDQAVAQGAEKIVVITPMMTSGGEHSEVDIPAAIQRAEALHPGIPIHYAWPFQVSEVAQFLAANIARFV